MAKPKGPTWDQVHEPGSNRIESRDCGGYLRKHVASGRTTVDLRCPFCKSVITAYVWSLSGGGKRCHCGALAGSGGIFHQLIQGA